MQCLSHVVAKYWEVKRLVKSVRQFFCKGQLRCRKLNVTFEAVGRLHTCSAKRPRTMSFIHPLGIAIAQSNKSPRQGEPRANGSEDFIKLKEERCFDPTSTLWKLFMTAIYCGCFFCFGTTMAILGPTLIELGNVVHRGLNQMSWLFFTQASYALVGASFAGIVIDRLAL